jgi:hypothetical protein
MDGLFHRRLLDAARIAPLAALVKRLQVAALFAKVWPIGGSRVRSLLAPIRCGLGRWLFRFRLQR